jgi:formylglycine-generating enzyme required for sulfatase activity
MRRIGWMAFVLVIAMLAATPAAHAQKRVALVIGNSTYLYAGVLANPKNDATDMAAALKKHGFQVIDGFDLDKAAFDRKVRDFASALKGADAGIFFYAGHGLQVSGVNYLVPIDAKAEGAETLEFEMVRASVVQGVMEQLTSTNILFLDACRNNPLARNLARAMGTRSTLIGRGLRSFEAGLGTLISFSTAPDTVASDGTGRNSPYTAALVKHVTVDTEDLAGILVAVRNDVIRATRKEQVPWEHSALIGRFYFNPAGQTAALPKVELARPSEAAEAWDRVKDSTNVSVLEAYIARYKGTFYAEMARARIDELKQQPMPELEQKTKRPELGEQKTALIETPKPLSPTQSPKPLTADEERSLKPKAAFRECEECPDMVVVPAGSFVMGSSQSEIGALISQYRNYASWWQTEGPQRKVTIAKTLAVGKYEVTFAEWDACVSAGGCKHKPDDQGWGRGKRPVMNVSWDDITGDYVPWLSRTTGKTYRLLTEAEWEYAARAGSTTPFSTGLTITGDQANFDGQRLKTVEVGTFQANAFGLHEVHGNVGEWVQDCHKNNYSGAPTDGTAVISGNCVMRVLRGGTWNSDPRLLRSAYRFGFAPELRNPSFGFRLARTLNP